MNKSKFNLKNKDLVAPCGLYCGECSGFQDGRCGGCISRRGLCLKYTRICRIYSCCAEKRRLRVCNKCKEFPCGKLSRFFDTTDWYKEVVENLQRVEKVGLETFLGEQVKRVNQLIRCAEKHDIAHCSLCAKWPCRKLERAPLTPA